MSSPAQVDVALLEKLTHLGPVASQDIKVFSNTNKDGSAGSSLEPCSEPGVPTDGSSNKEGTDQLNHRIERRQGFQPERKYFVEGRIIHKRKLSRKLFFLDVSLVRRKRAPKQESTAAALIPGKVSTADLAAAVQTEALVTPSSEDSEGIKESEWEDMEMSQGSETDRQLQNRSQHRMEVITRFPVHSLKDLDDLWRRVQLGAVVRVFGDIELSEKKNKPTSAPLTNGSGECTGQRQWTALLHCLDFDLLEEWKGEDAFEPNPGSAEVTQRSSSNPDKDGNVKKQDRKRKSGEMVGEDDPSNTLVAEKRQQRGDESQPHCKFWLNSGKCNKEQCLFWHEIDPLKLKAERQRWVEERVQAKRKISHHASDPHQKTTKNQHRERALYFAQWLISTFTRDFLNSGTGVLDIAGGRGDLSWELQTRQGIQSTVIEPRPGKGMRKWQRKWLEKFKVGNQRVQPANDVAGIQAQVQVQVQEATAESRISREDSSMADAIDTEEHEPDDERNLAGLVDFIPKDLIHPLQATDPARIQTMLDDAFLIQHEAMVRDASIMVGLHPDQATEPIVRAALKIGKPFAVIPCCVFGRENPHRRLPKHPRTVEASEIEAGNKGVHAVEQDDEAMEEDTTTRPVTSYDDFVTWLSTLHPEIETTWLNFEGMNRVLFWRGPSLSGSISSNVE
ncbi:hypothetical protein BG011_009835 [Mortierella polycephala]|uniref:C3H1-type domain-containing protein n=1 Tax=Mortierella polycephala TaxID=41804 RepID=A0A9P6U6J3_9FUNG|nr:hypothetical protein BG011_009835 [Mortierella polycephala]